jgi:hypothetical protein
MIRWINMAHQLERTIEIRKLETPKSRLLPN